MGFPLSCGRKGVRGYAGGGVRVRVGGCARLTLAASPRTTVGAGFKPAPTTSSVIPAQAGIQKGAGLGGRGAQRKLTQERRAAYHHPSLPHP